MTVWLEDMREVLVRFTNKDDLGQLCVCKANNRKAVRNSSEFTSIWLKHEQKKKKVPCSVPGCSV